MSKESIQGPLTALRNAGTVCGVCLVRGTEIVVNLFPFSEERMTEVITLVDDIFGYLANQNRQVDQMCYGYDGGNLVIVTDEDYRLIVMHMLPDEVDFIAKAARAFLIDFQVGLFAEQLSGQNPRLTGAGLTRELPAVVIPGEPSSSREEESPQPAPSGEVPAETPAASPAPAAGSRVIPSPGMMQARQEDDSASSSGAAEEPEATHGAHLAPNQPESTLPPPRRPKGR